MNRAKGPSSLHSPFSAPGLDSSPEVEFVDDSDVMAEMTAEWVVDVARYEDVDERNIAAISEGSDWTSDVEGAAWSRMDISGMMDSLGSDGTGRPQLPVDQRATGNEGGWTEIGVSRLISLKFDVS